MTKKPPFSKAAEKDIYEIVRGDIVVYLDPKNGNWQRGIVYNPVRTTLDPNIIGGFRILPLDTVGKNVKSSSPYPTLEKTSPDIVQQASGNPNVNKTVVSFNILALANVSKMTQLSGKTIWTLGSYSGSPYMVELLDKVSELYEKQELFVGGQKIQPTTKIKIVPSETARQVAIDNSRARRKAYERMAEDKNKPGESSIAKQLGEKAKEPKKPVKQETPVEPVKAVEPVIKSMTLEEALAADHISERTLNFLKEATLKDEGRAPETLTEAYNMIVNSDQLTKVYGMASKGKVYQSIVAEVKEAAAKLGLDNGPA